MKRADEEVYRYLNSIRKDLEKERPLPNYYRTIRIPELKKEDSAVYYNKYKLDFYSNIETEIILQCNFDNGKIDKRYGPLDEAIINILEWKKYDGLVLTAEEEELLAYCIQHRKERYQAEDRAGQDL